MYTYRTTWDLFLSMEPLASLSKHSVSICETTCWVVSLVSTIIATSVLVPFESPGEKRGSKERGDPIFFLTKHSLRNVERLFKMRSCFLPQCTAKFSVTIMEGGRIAFACSSNATQCCSCRDLMLLFAGSRRLVIIEFGLEGVTFQLE